LGCGSRPNTPTPQTPIPNPQSPFKISFIFSKNNIFLLIA